MAKAPTIETCTNCRRGIGRLERAYLHRGHVVCKKCYHRLAERGQHAPKRVQAQQPRTLPAKVVHESQEDRSINLITIQGKPIYVAASVVAGLLIALAIYLKTRPDNVVPMGLPEMTKRQADPVDPSQTTATNQQQLRWTLVELQERWPVTDGWEWSKSPKGFVAIRKELYVRIELIGKADGISEIVVVKPIEERALVDDSVCAAWLLEPIVMTAFIIKGDMSPIGKWAARRWAHTISQDLPKYVETVSMNRFCLCLAFSRNDGLAVFGLSIFPLPSDVPPPPHISTISGLQKRPPEFTYNNVSAQPMGDAFKIIGEMTNNTSKLYQVACFTLSVYDADRKLVATANIIIANLGPGQTRSFDAYIETLPDGWTYKIDPS